MSAFRLVMLLNPTPEVILVPEYKPTLLTQLQTPKIYLPLQSFPSSCFFRLHVIGIRNLLVES